MFHGDDAGQHSRAPLPGDTLGVRMQLEHGMVQSASMRLHATGIKPLCRHGQEDLEGRAVLRIDMEFRRLIVFAKPFIHLVRRHAEQGQIILQLRAVIFAAARPERGGIT